MTLTLMVQVLLGASVPLENDSEAAPPVGAKVGVPHPEVEALGGLATVMAPGEVGRVSVKLTPVMVTEVGFVIVKVRVETPPATVELGENALAMVTLAAGSIMDATRAPVEKSLL